MSRTTGVRTVGQTDAEAENFGTVQRQRSHVCGQIMCEWEATAVV